MVKPKDASGRNGRYFIASTMIVVGLACAALLTDSVGNTLATVLIAGGLILFVAFLFKDLGITTTGRSTPRVPPLPPLPGEEHDSARAASAAPDPAPVAPPAADAPRTAAESARRLAGVDGHGDGTGPT